MAGKQSAKTAEEDDRSVRSFKKQPIKILLYTDNSDTKIDNSAHGLGTMVAHLKAHEPAFAEFDVTLLCRNAGGSTPAENKLVKDLVNKFDEIWFFGYHQINRKRPGQLFLRGSSSSELEPEEIVALKNWMKVSNQGGGVMVTGDHSEIPPADAVKSDLRECPDSGKGEPLGIGRAIGRCVPRAGQMRNWDGLPTSQPRDSFNTQVSRPGIDVDLLLLQIDHVPQRLVLPHFDDQGNQVTNGEPHQLFWYTSDNWIRVFPDHAHEGAVVLPTAEQLADEEMWPKVQGKQPTPKFVAYGIDERNCRLLPLIATYNGDAVNRGRVVTNSSFHHYLNINLTNYPPGQPVGSDADQIGRYYSNLALWLCPRSQRRRMAEMMISRIASHPSILEEFGNHPLIIGRAAYFLLLSESSVCEIHELLQAMMPNSVLSRFDSLCFPEKGITVSRLPSRELILGSIIHDFQHRMRTIEASSTGKRQVLEAKRALSEAIDTGIRNSFQMQANVLKQFATAADELIPN